MRSLMRRAWVTDGLIAAAFVAVGQAGRYAHDGSGFLGTLPTAVDVPLVAAISVPLAWRRAAPFSVLLLVCTAICLPQAFADVTLPLFGGLGTLAFALYNAARHAARPLDHIALAPAVATIALLGLEIDDFASWGQYAFSGPVLLIAWLVGQGLRRWQRSSELLRGHLADLNATEVSRAASARADERARIARELHDVVAHSVSVMVVQAGSARMNLDRDSAASEAALRSVESTGRQALVEMRRMLGVLRTDPQDMGLAPQPSLRGLDALATQMRAAGLSVDIHVDGVPVDLPPGLDLSAYRIVQEALTNALKHAGPTRADLCIRYRPDRLDLDVVNAPGSGTPARAPGGHGIVGMRERVALFGGTLTAGPEGDGGYAIHASLPTPEPRPEPLPELAR